MNITPEQRRKETILVTELGLELSDALVKDDEIDQDHAIANIIACMVNAQMIEPDRFFHFYKEAIEKLKEVR